MYFAEAQSDRRAAQVKVVVESPRLGVSIVVNCAVFDTLIDGCSGGAVSVGHDAHFVVMDVAIADSDVIGLIDANAGAIIGVVGRPSQLKTLKYAVVSTTVELEDGPWCAPASAVFEALARERYALAGLDSGSADSQVRLVHIHPDTLVSFSTRPRIDLNYVPRSRLRYSLLDTVESLARSDF